MIVAALQGKTRFLVLAACVLSAGCAQMDKAPALGDGKSVEIRQGTVANFEGLRIGLSNIVNVEHACNVGGKKRGLEAVLVLFVEGNPPQEKQYAMCAGQTVNLDKYSVYAQEIKGGSKGSVTLQVKAAGQSPAP
ncbi:MAG: hypothetical protein WC943_03315 [Elusimicrobiota bacterium]